MPFTIPDKGEGLNDIQSVVFQEYLDILVAGISAVDSVISGCAVTTAGTNMVLSTGVGTVFSNNIHLSIGAAAPTIPPADATNPRLDFISVTSAGAVVVRVGTPSVAPRPPTKVANDVVLAVVFVPAGDTAITSNQIVDLRVISTVLASALQAQTFVAFTTAGTSTAYTLTPSPAITSYAARQRFAVTFAIASGANPTIAINGLAGINLVKLIGDGTYANIAANDITINHQSQVTVLSPTQVLVERLREVPSAIVVTAQAQPAITSVGVLTGLSVVGVTTLGLDPVLPLQAATKQYVDALAQSLDIKESVRVASTVDIAISTALINTAVIDGVTVATGDRVLLKNQTAGEQNGIYVVVATGAASRSVDANSSSEVTSGMYVFVSEGTASSDMGFVLTTNDPITLGTTALSFTQFSGAGQITAGAGLTKTGNTVDVIGTSGRIVVTPDSIDIGVDVVTLAGTQTLTNKLISGGQITSSVANATLSATVTTNANLTGPITSVGNATAITDLAITTTKLADAAVTQAQVKVKAVVALADVAATLTAAQMVDSTIFTITPTVARILTTDTAANIVAALPRYQVGTWFNIVIVNNAAFDVTLAAGTGVTIVGKTVINNVSGTWTARIDSATAITIYRG